MMLEDNSESQGKSDGKTPQAYTKRQELNNHIVCMRKCIRQASVQIISRLNHQIKRYKSRKGDGKEQDKAQRKASRLLEEINILKKINKDKASLHALVDTEPLEQVLGKPDASAEDRALSRISHHKVVKAKVDEYRGANPNWDKQIPVLLHMTREKRGRKKDKSTSEAAPQKNKPKQGQDQDSSEEPPEETSDIEDEANYDDNSVNSSLSEDDEPERVKQELESGTDQDSEDSEEAKPPVNSKQVKVDPANQVKLKKEKPKPPRASPRGKAPLPSVNKSVGTIKVQLLTDLRQLEEDSLSKSSPEKDLIDVTQVPSVKRPRSAFFVGGVDQADSDEEGERRPKSFQQQHQHPSRDPNFQSKPVFKKGKLVSKPQFPPRSNFPPKGKAPFAKDGKSRSRFSVDPNSEPLGTKRFRSGGDVIHRNQPEVSSVSESSEKLHPSWEAKKKQQNISLTSFQGKKIKFDEDD